jgi:hypothetical protein
MLVSTPGRNSRSEAVKIPTLIDDAASVNAELICRPDCRETVYGHRRCRVNVEYLILATGRSQTVLIIILEIMSQLT